MSIQQLRNIRLKPGKERSVLNFHPWIFSGAIQSDVKSIAEGETVTVSGADGNFLAVGHFHHGTIMVRVLSFEETEINETFWYNKIAAAYSMRSRLPFMENGNTNTYRLIHGEGDGVPGLIIDVYGNNAVVQLHSQGMLNSAVEIGAALKRFEPLQLETIYCRSTEQHPAEGYFMHGNAVSGEVTENGHRYFVNWVEGQKTGFFLDQRENRALLAGYVKNKSVLNTFCYSGGFSVYAVQAGAAYVVSVDSSAKAVEWTKKNIALNSNDSTHHEAFCEDVFDFLKRSDNTFDVIVLDPPAFAKHRSSVDKAVVGYRNLNYDAIKRVKPGGIIFTFSCSQAIDKQLFRKTVFTAAAKTGRFVRVLHQLSQGPDHPINIYHPEGEYLKGLVLQVS